MLENIRGLSDWCRKDYIMIYRLWRWRIVKQNELDGDSKFTMTIGLGGKLSSHWKTNKRQSWKWRDVWQAYRNPNWNLMLDRWVLRIKERSIGHMLFLP
jgi:hypothetical protein